MLTATMTGGRLALVGFAALTVVHCAGRWCTAEEGFFPGPWTKDFAAGPGVVADSRILRGSEFHGLDLSDANFRQSDLSRTTFQGCRLADVSFRGACLVEARFEDCFGWGDSEPHTFHSVDFTDADISGAQFEAGAVMSPSQLMSTHSYKKRDLARCALRVSRFGYDDGPPLFSFARFDLSRSRLYGDFTAADFSDADVAGAEFSRGAIRFQQIVATRNYRSGRLSGITLVLDGEDCDFTGIDLTGSSLTVRNGAVVLVGAVVTRTRFLDTDVGGQIAATASYRRGESSRLILASPTCGESISADRISRAALSMRVSSRTRSLTMP